jgi:hypothetical protein
MTRVLMLVSMAILLCAGCAANKAQVRADGTSSVQTKPERVLRHVVLFKFKDDTTPEQTKTIEDAFRALPGKIPAIQDFEWGTNVSPENLSQGFTHCFFVTFRDAAGRDSYLPHPAHKEFGAILGPYMEKALVLDYWTRK